MKVGETPALQPAADEQRFRKVEQSPNHLRYRAVRKAQGEQEGSDQRLRPAQQAQSRPQGLQGTFPFYVISRLAFIFLQQRKIGILSVRGIDGGCFDTPSEVSQADNLAKNKGVTYGGIPA